ncbi:MAG TPA: DUF3052 domain-containing protein [Microbacterium sp.]|nr:DUF3052 domain-containing protein [Microbacterium sp.]
MVTREGSSLSINRASSEEVAMPRTTAEKLQIKPGTELLFGPSTPEQRALLDPLPEGVAVVDGIHRDTADVAVMFASDRDELDALLSDVLPLLSAPRAIWIGFPKGNRADINRDSIWRRVEEVGWTLTANISLSDVWSSVRLKRVG